MRSLVRPPLFTPGPWSVHKDSDNFVIESDDTVIPVTVVERPADRFYWTGREDADAALIASAPALFDALYDIVRVACSTDNLACERMPVTTEDIARWINLLNIAGGHGK